MSATDGLLCQDTQCGRVPEAAACGAGDESNISNGNGVGACVFDSMLVCALRASREWRSWALRRSTPSAGTTPPISLNSSAQPSGPRRLSPPGGQEGTASLPPRAALASSPCRRGGLLKVVCTVMPCRPTASFGRPCTAAIARASVGRAASVLPVTAVCLVDDRLRLPEFFEVPIQPPAPGAWAACLGACAEGASVEELTFLVLAVAVGICQARKLAELCPRRGACRRSTSCGRGLLYLTEDSGVPL